MSEIRRKYQIIIFIIILTTCITIGFICVFSIKKVKTIYTTNTRNTIINLQKDFLKDTVNNMEIRINEIRKELKNKYTDNDKLIEKTKEIVKEEIHNQKFSEDTYIWVNEIINYDGGDNYAIRRIHPNLIDTEGSYLSTNMKDIKGNTPYLTELQGVKENGEIYFTYFFKRKNSNEISEKLTYAKLYKDFDWVIAMGIHTDDIQHYIDLTNKENNEIIRLMILYIILAILFIFIITSTLLSLLERWYFSHSNKSLMNEIFFDPLLKIYNRRAAINHLTGFFKDFSINNLTYAIFMIDVDDFKKINDTYGHNIGDMVLKKITDYINSFVRNSDKLYRWGGEEFILVCEGLRKENVTKFSEKLINSLNEITYEADEISFNVTVSIGVSYFNNDDKGYEDAIKRADVALYKAKSEGKNRVVLSFPV